MPQIVSDSSRGGEVDRQDRGFGLGAGGPSVSTKPEQNRLHVQEVRSAPHLTKLSLLLASINMAEALTSLDDLEREVLQ